MRKVKDKGKDKSGDNALHLEEYERFNQIVEEHCQAYGISASECHPRVVFIGDTGTGKSSLIRLLIEHAWKFQTPPDTGSFSVPVIGAPLATEPTSGNVHSYRDHAVDSPDKSSPLLYADCEGFKGPVVGSLNRH